jgi:FRG domain
MQSSNSVARVQSWTELLEQLYAGSWNPDLQRFRSPFAFRGLDSVDHDLSNSLMRLAGVHGDVNKVELALLRNFRKYAHAQAAHGVDSIWHWLAVAQHHGLPTRMVDWTYSPFVALHFATALPGQYDADGVVWCVNFVEANRLLPDRLKRILVEEQSDTLTVEMLGEIGSLRAFDSLATEPFVVFVEPPSLDVRILNQFALFSLLSSPTASLDDWVRRHPQLCRKVVVPAELKWEIRDKLDQANINERTLFPDLDGLSRWLERYYLPKPRD